MAILVDILSDRLKCLLTLPALAALVAIYVGYQLTNTYFSSLRGIPGPFMLRITKRWFEQTSVRGRMVKVGLDGMHQYGDIFVCQPQSVVISDPEDIRSVLSSPLFPKSPYYRVFRFSGDDSSITITDPHEFSSFRRMLGPYFSTTYFNKMEPLVFEYGIRAVMRRWDTLLKQSITGQIRVNYNLTFRMCTFNVTSRLVYGQEIAALDARNSDLSIKWMSESTTYLFVRALMMVILPKPMLYIAALMWDHRFKPFLNHIHNSIAERKRLLATVDKKDERPVDLLQALIDCEDPESKVRLTGNQIHTEATMQMIAAVDTSAYTLTWTTHLFMLYPECYQRVVREVRTQFPLSDTDAVPEITYAMAKASLPYLEACLHESMRMMPIIQAMLPRVVPEEGTTIKGHFLPGGTTVFCNVPGSHLNPKYWQDPHCFNPERFLDPATRRKAINSVFTFGHGSRICMGKHLAWIELLTIMANLLRHYDFKMPDNYTRTGPNIIDPATGHPKLMEKTEFMSARPAYYEKDCVIIVSPAKSD